MVVASLWSKRCYLVTLKENIKDFVSCNILRFFRILEVSHVFLQNEPRLWEDKDYKSSRDNVRSTTVGNDIA